MTHAPPEIHSLDDEPILPLFRRRRTHPTGFKLSWLRWKRARQQDALAEGERLHGSRYGARLTLEVWIEAEDRATAASELKLTHIYPPGEPPGPALSDAVRQEVTNALLRVLPRKAG